MGDGVGNAVGEGMNQSHVLFDRFVQATTCKGTLKAFQELCDFLELKPNEYRVFYHKLKSKLNYWKAKALWAKLDKRASHKEYKKGRACANTKCLIIGAGPCGLRTAIELGFLGAKVILLEKRDAFSRNNVLHLWPFTIHDLRGLGAKKFYGKFCAGAIDHISIRQLQLMLLKVALLLGIEIHVNVEFRGLIEPPEDQENERIGWRAEVHPRTHPVNELEFDVIIGADGRRNTLSGFKRKEFRGKLAIAITANFINRNTTAEAKVEEISGVAFIFNQKFFQDLREATGIDLENIVYYKDDTHYFVMTAKKQSLLEKGVILHDYADTEMLLSRANVDQKALLSYAREAADFSTNHQLPKLDFAINHYGQPDVAMFDFTCMYASENAALVRQRNAHKLLVALVGDSLLEPFWPMGTGIARGFLAGMDAAWMVRSWAQGSSPLEVLAERESIYRLLPQTTPENVSKNFSQYSVDPTTRYPNISLHQVRPNQVRHLLDSGEIRDLRVDMENVVNSSTPKLTRNEILLEKQLQESIVRSSKLLNWCQRQTEGYRGVSVSDLTTCWKSGLALCALIHCYRPDLIDFDSLDEKDVEKNNQLGFDVAEKEFGISPIMTGKEMSVVVEPDKLSMVMYLSQFYEMFKDTVPPGENHNMSPEEKAALIASTKSPISFFSKLGQSIAISRKRNPKDKKEKELDGLGKRRKTSQAGQSEDEELQRVNRDDRPSIAAALAERKIDSAAAVNNNNKVKVMATQLLAKFEENAPTQSTGLKRQGNSMPDLGLILTPSLKESVRLAPVPAWRKASSGTEVLRCCPKKTILLSSSSPSSSSFSSSFPPHAQHYVNQSEINTCNGGGDEENEIQDPSIYYREDNLPNEDKPEPIHIPSIQERVDTLVSRFKGKPDRKDKPQVLKKPSRFFEQWLLTHRLSPEQPFYPSDPQHQRREVLRSDDHLPLHIPSIQERAERLASQFKDKPAKPKSKKKAPDFFTEHWYRPRDASSVSPLHSPSSFRQGSLRKEFPQNIGGSDVCFFCRKRVYVMERLSAEGKFFHRSCFKCDYCGTTLRLSSYAFDVEDGKFYCKPHYCYRLSGLAQRKRPAAPAPVNAKEPQVLAVTPNTVDAPGQAITSQDPVERRPSVTEVNGVTEPSVAKRLKGTPERIELENYRLSMMREEELQEVPEETLAEHNLSSVLDKATYVEEGSSSSESDMEEEDEEPEAAGPSDLGGVPWKEAVELHAKLKGESDPGAADYDNGLHDGEMDEDEEEEEDEDEEEEEEESSDEPCEEDDDPEAEAGSPDFEPGTEIDQEDIPSDAEAEARSHCIDEVVMLPVDNGKAEIQGHVSNTEKTSANPMELIVDVVLSPIQKPALPIEEVKEVSPVILVKSPGARFFPEPYLLDDVKPNIPLPLSPDAKSPYSPAAQIIALSPICSQPVPQPETTSLKSPVQHEPCACSPTGNPLSPICTQSQPCNEPPSPLSTSSPVRTQPVPAITSTPLAKPSSEKRTNEPLKDSVPEETPVKKTDLIEEFWLKSAEIRKSLGLSPLERSKPSVEKSIVKTPTPGSPSPKSFTPEDLSEEHKPSFTGRSVIRRINITLEGQVISPVEPKSSGSEKKDLSSSSGLGLNGSVTTSQTVASDSYNNSDSTMLTPPSSPPPPPPNEEPASLQNKRSQMSWDNLLEATEEPKPETTPPKPKTPVSPPQPKPLVAPVPDPGTNPPVVMRVKEPNKPRREEVRKSFVECVEEIPFADDVEETYDDHTPDTSVLERFYTPPTSKVNREKPPLHLAMENGKPNIPGGVSQTAKGPQRFSPEAKEIAEERMRAREKSVKSQALKDAMSKQLTKMKESDAAKGAVAKVAWNVPETTGKSKKQSNTLKDSAVKALESKKQTDTPPDRFFTTPTSKTLDSSVTSSESSTGGKSKKRSSLFSPRKNKKEKKAKNERLSGTEETPPKHKSLWKAVFSGYKKDKKKKDDKSCPSTSSSSTTEDSGKKKESPLDRSSDLRLRRNLSFSEDSDLSCDDVLERSSQKSKGDKTYTEEELNAKLTRRVQKAARRQAKQEELKRLHRAQIIQRQLEQVEEKQRQLEERGVAVEKALRGEAGMGKKDDPKLMQEWFKLVQEKNALVRYESELMIFARELELEDRQSRLQQELRERMAVDDHLKTEKELAEEKRILNEMLEVVEQRDSLVALLEEQRLQEKEEDKDLEAVMLSKGFSLNWA
ncbi:protein-methionine sulfoxide oxidase mical3a isoform X18 [Carassius gibelio]|uniref:protein-methionine sulfoxide oxidase mical3a isoform X18 n=1 Tax=Carassius gibelio TaxID=101364 RepID=UPI0022793A6B|nr:protein-methionine sulfoxide oxidase mical3a isoform X18 [Carassius gibelio]